MNLLTRPAESLLIATALRLFFVVSSVALGLTLWLSGKSTELALKNLITPAERQTLILGAAAAGLLACVAAVFYLLTSKRRSPLLHLNRLTRLASPLLVTAALPSLFNWEAFRNRDFMFAVLGTLFGLALERTFRTAVVAYRELGASFPPLAIWRARRRRPPPTPRPDATSGVQPALTGSASRPSRRLPTWLKRHAASLVMSALVLAFAALMAVDTIRQHYQFKTYSWDLGIFNNLMYNLIRGHWFKASPVLGPEGSHIQFHATFGAYLLAPFYALWQKPETLLAMQAILVAAGAIPLYLLAKLRLRSGWLGLVFVYSYLVYAPLHGPLFYDFHFLTISPVFVLITVYCFEAGHRKRLVLAWLVAISMREEVSATLAVCALYYLLSGKRPRWALWGGALSALYFLVVKFGVMPAHAKAGQSFSWIFKDLIAPGEAGFGSVLRTLITSPVYAFSTVFSPQKFEYLLRTLGPALLLVVRQRLVWMLCLPAFLFTLLSTGYEPMLKTRFQYTANWTPYVMLASIFVLDGWRRTAGGGVRFAAAVPALCLVATLFSYNFGALFQRNTFVGGFHKVDFEVSDAQWRSYQQLRKLIDQIPESAKVSACELIVPHVSSREDAYTLNRSGAGDADYLICNKDWLRRSPVKGFMQSALASNAYSFVGTSGNFAMWKKGGDHRRDKLGFKLIGGMGKQSARKTLTPAEPPPQEARAAESAGGSAPESPTQPGQKVLRDD